MGVGQIDFVGKLASRFSRSCFYGLLFCVAYWVAGLLIVSWAGIFITPFECSIRSVRWFPFVTCGGLRQGTNHILNAPAAFLVAPVEIIRLSAITGHYMDLIFAVPTFAIHVAGWSYAVAKTVRLTISLKHM